MLLQGMPAGTLTAKYETDHRRALDSIKGDRIKELDKLKTEAAASASAQQALTQKLDKVTARRSILEQKVYIAAVCPVLLHLY